MKRRVRAGAGFVPLCRLPHTDLQLRYEPSVGLPLLRGVRVFNPDAERSWMCPPDPTVASACDAGERDVGARVKRHQPPLREEISIDGVGAGGA